MLQRGRKITPSIPAASLFASMVAMLGMTRQEHSRELGTKMKKMRMDKQSWNVRLKKKRLRKIARLSRRVNRQRAA